MQQKYGLYSLYKKRSSQNGTVVGVPIRIMPVHISAVAPRHRKAPRAVIARYCNLCGTLAVGRRLCHTTDRTLFNDCYDKIERRYTHSAHSCTAY